MSSWQHVFVFSQLVVNSTGTHTYDTSIELADTEDQTSEDAKE